MKKEQEKSVWYEPESGGCYGIVRQDHCCTQERKKMSQIEVAAALTNYGVTVRNTAVSSWEKNTSLPNVVQFLALCKILNITDIYNEFIGCCRETDPLAGLNEKGRERALEYISLLESSDRYRKEETTVIPFIREMKLFDLPASAGHGEFLDGEDYTMIEVGAEVPSSAEFGVRIRGTVWNHGLSTGRLCLYNRPGR